MAAGKLVLVVTLAAALFVGLAGASKGDGLVLDPDLSACPICEPCDERYKVHPDADSNPFKRQFTPDPRLGGWGPRTVPFLDPSPVGEPGSFWLWVMIGCLVALALWLRYVVKRHNRRRAGWIKRTNRFTRQLGKENENF